MSHSPSVALPKSGTVASVLDRPPEPARQEDGFEPPFGKMLAAPPVKEGLRKDPARKVEDVTAGAENNPSPMVALPLPSVAMVRDVTRAVEFASEGQRSAAGAASTAALTEDHPSGAPDATQGHGALGGSEDSARQIRDGVARQTRDGREISVRPLDVKATVKPGPALETKLIAEAASPAVTTTVHRLAEQRAPSVTLMLGLAPNSVSELRRPPARGLEAAASAATAAAAPIPSSVLGGGPVPPPPTVNGSLRETAATDSMTQALRSQVLNYELSLKTEGWESHLTSHISNMLDVQGYEAVVRVNPEHLGQIEISISVQQGEVSVRFGAEIADTRAVLEHAVPQLRELLGNEGLQLSQMTVSASLGREIRSPAPGSAVFSGLAQNPRSDRLLDARPAEAPARPSRGRRGSLDLFA